MSLMDPAQDTAAALSALQAALAAAQAAPPDQVGVQEDEEDTADIATPRAKAATALETALRSRYDWHRRHGEPAGERVCRTLIDMCAWHEHPELREQVLALQAWGLALLTAARGGEPDLADADALEDAYQSIKPREDDAAAIAAALGMTLEEARAFGLVGTLDHVGFEDEEPARVPVEAGVASASVPAPEEDLETLFRREALILVGKTLPQALQRFWGAQQSVDALLTVRRCFHTLKGDARVTAQSTPMEVAEELEGLAVLSEAAEDIIDYLLGDDYDTEQPAPGLPPGAFSLLNEVATAIGRRLELRAPLDNEAALLHRLEAMQRKAVAVSGTAIDDATFAAKIPLPKPKQPAPRPTPTKFAPHSLLPTFLEEADRLMPDLHRALAVLSSTPTDEGALVRARVKLHTLKGGAALIGDEALEIQNIAHSAEDLFELIEDFQLRGEMDRVPREVLEGVLDAEDALQVLLDILRRQTQTGRLGSTTRLLPMPPQQLVTMLDSIAERVRRGDIGKPPVPGTEVAAAAGEASAGTGSEAPAPVDDARAPAAERLPHTTRPSSPLLGAVPLPPLPGVGTLASTPLMQRVVLPPSGDVASANEPELARASSASASVDLRTVTFRDLLAGIERTEIRTAGAVADWARLVEDRTRAAREPFTLFTCVQLLSNYEQDRERYCKLAHENGHLYVFGKADALPLPAEHTTFVPLEDGDALLAERVVIVDTANNPMAFFACTVGTDAVQPVQTYTTAYVEARAVVQEAVTRLRAVLQRDAALIATRRAGVPGTLPQLGTALPDRPEAAPAERQRLHRDRTPRSVPEYGKDYSVGVALSALEDLSVSRDALQELVAEMLRQSIESRRSSRRLRTLVERVSVELSGLRSELVRTSRRSGDWDLLEKEEYTTVDVLLMQLDEALADLEESDSNLRRDLGEAQAQVEIQADNQLRAQRSLLNMSMIPFSQLEDRLNHAVRSQSRRLGKQVGFSLEGGELVLDGHIAESLFEPLMHLINNALDHGIEENAADRVAAGKPVEGHLTIRGRANGDGVAIDVTDDGRGIDPERIAAVAVSRGIVSAQEAAGMSAQDRLALIWRPGFSTARRISTISGRGMGLQSVLDEIIGLQGRIEIHSEVGKGTTFTVLLPRSLAMLRVEVVREGRDLLAFPITQVVATHPVAYTAVENADPGLVLHLGGRDLTVYSAHLATGPAGDGEAGHGMLLEVAGRSGGILVDEVIGSQYLPVRAAPDYLRRHCGVLGYAVGGAGRILPILDLPTLVDRSAPDQPIVSSEQPARPAYSVLVVDDSQTMRRALRDTLSKAGFLVREAADGRDALTICTRAMPDLITLDMEMPGMDGLEALSALRLLPNGGDAVPVFMITSRQQARHRAAALAAGVTRYFTKPYDTDELIGAAQLVLAEGIQQRREAAS